MKQFYVLLWALVLSLSAVAQVNFKPGYIVNLDSSRTEGLVDFRGTNSKAARLVTFKANEASEETTYQPTQIAGYGIAEGKQYESITITEAGGTGDTYFMEVLAKGAATLYFMKSDEQKERFFVVTGSGRLHELIEETRRVDDGKGNVYNATLKLYVGVLTSVLEACPDVKPMISKARFEQSDLVRVVNKYNACVAPEKVEVARTADELKPKVEKLVILGGTYTDASFGSNVSADDYATKGDITPSVDITAGMAFNITANKLSRKLSFYTGLVYQQYRLEGKYKKDFAGGAYYTYDYYLEAKHVKVPLMIRYTWPRGKVRGFINAGAQAGLLLDAASNVKRYGKFGTQENNYEFEMMPAYRKTELSFVGGLGLKTEVFGKRVVTLEVRQERNSGLSAGVGFTQRNNITSVLLGIGL